MCRSRCSEAQIVGMRSQFSWMSRWRVPFFVSGNTHGLPPTRERLKSTFAVGGDGTTRPPSHHPDRGVEQGWW